MQDWEANYGTVFDQAEIDATLDLLSRNGQVVAQKGDIRFLIDITNEQEYTIETMRKADKG